MQAQEELLAGVAKSAARGERSQAVVETESTTAKDAEVAEPYDRSMSPALLDIRKLPYEERQIDIVTELEDLRALVCLTSHHGNHYLTLHTQIAQRRGVATSRFVPRTTQPAVEQPTTETTSNADVASEALFRAEAERDLDEEEELFNVEEDIAQVSYNWEDKWRPRKPRYFNRVHTGYEWNKYNQTHYEFVILTCLRRLRGSR